MSSVDPSSEACVKQALLEQAFSFCSEDIAMYDTSLASVKLRLLVYGYNDRLLMLTSAVVSLGKELYSHYSYLLCRWLYYSSAGQIVALYVRMFGALLKNSTRADAIFHAPPLGAKQFKNRNVSRWKSFAHDIYIRIDHFPV